MSSQALYPEGVPMCCPDMPAMSWWRCGCSVCNCLLHAAQMLKAEHLAGKEQVGGGARWQAGGCQDGCGRAVGARPGAADAEGRAGHAGPR